ncbi:rhodanese-like domain-containing protein [Streptomyces sp. H27-D2]|uniref:rhodanese-like domain-containing protein n=1 Tax=Streptomyces sp. H27-D2 TaxID=3046304 RepID=UPI002DBB3CE3|nr:rhodanese-like domain-containing protein [Streptomyces sp. H27-D2]MEC4015277.1 rhodanese-like domain-containing protein [Streptomyces sp. H27-D2]
MAMEPSADLDPLEAERLVAAGGAVLLDVRESEEWEAGHAPDAVHIPLCVLEPDQVAGRLAGLVPAAGPALGPAHGAPAHGADTAGSDTAPPDGSAAAVAAAPAPAASAVAAPGRTVIAVCRSGRRSAQAAFRLRAAGIDARNLGGGMQAWARSGLPVRRSDGRPGTVA